MKQLLQSRAPVDITPKHNRVRRACGRLGFADRQHQLIPATPSSTDDLTQSSAREETMASWQIKGLLALSAALAAITLAASAPAVEDRPAQVMPAARIAD
jgi:hypothetical protein